MNDDYGYIAMVDVTIRIGIPIERRTDVDELLIDHELLREHLGDADIIYYGVEDVINA